MLRHSPKAAMPIPLPIPPAAPVVVTMRESRWLWATTVTTAVVAVATLAIGIAQVTQSFTLNRSQLELHGERVLDLEPATVGQGQDLVIAVTLRNLGGMPTTIYQAELHAVGSPIYASPKTLKPFAFDFPSSSPKPGIEPFLLSKEVARQIVIGLAPATIVDLSPDQVRQTLPIPIRVEARDVRAAPIFLRLRVDAKSVDELKALVQQRREALWVDLYDEEDRVLRIPVWDCSSAGATCSGVLFK
jgi:hypothetical protein